MKKYALFVFILPALAAFFAPRPSLAVTFGVMGDTQSFLAGSGSFSSAVANLKKKKPRAVIMVGDLITDCSDNESCRNSWENWKTIASPILGKIYPAMGNHDRLNSSREAADNLWQEVFDLPANGPEGFDELAYSFNKGNSHFIVLNSSKPDNYRIGSVQRAWLRQDLARHRKKKNKFVFFHMPAFPVSSHIGSSLDVYPEERDALWEILDEYDIDAVFNGHEHFFNRRKIDSSVFPGVQHPIYQFTVGRTDTTNTYPAPSSSLSEYFIQENHFAVVNAKNKSIKIDVYSTGGTLLHSFRYRK